MHDVSESNARPARQACVVAARSRVRGRALGNRDPRDRRARAQRRRASARGFAEARLAHFPGTGPVTQLPPGGGEGSRTGRTLAALEKLGFTQRDRMRLRFSFEAATLHQAVELASELRTIAESVVQVRPGHALLRVKRRWKVTLSTPPTALAPAAIHRWES